MRTSTRTIRTTQSQNLKSKVYPTKFESVNGGCIWWNIRALTTATPVRNIYIIWFSMQSLNKFIYKRSLNGLKITVHNESWNRRILSAMIIVMYFSFKAIHTYPWYFQRSPNLNLYYNKNVKCSVILPPCCIKLHMFKW